MAVAMVTDAESAALVALFVVSLIITLLRVWLAVRRWRTIRRFRRTNAEWRSKSRDNA